MSVRYYTYVSDAKVDLLYGQIPPRPLSRIAGELKIDLKVLSVSVSLSQAEQTRYDRLKIVERYVRREYDVTAIENPGVWIEAQMNLRSAFHGGRQDGMLFMTGCEGDTLVVLIGSAYHLVADRSQPAVGESQSGLPALFALLERDPAERGVLAAVKARFQGSSPVRDEDALHSLLGLVDRATGPGEPCLFLSRRLYHGMAPRLDGPPVRTVIATPLYVALSGS